MNQAFHTLSFAKQPVYNRWPGLASHEQVRQEIERKRVGRSKHLLLSFPLCRLESLLHLLMICSEGSCCWLLSLSCVSLCWPFVSGRGLAEPKDSLIFTFRLMSAVIFSLLEQVALFTEGSALPADESSAISVRISSVCCLVSFLLMYSFIYFFYILANQPVG